MCMYVKARGTLWCHCEESHFPHFRSPISLKLTSQTRLGDSEQDILTLLLLQFWDCKHAFPNFSIGSED